MLWIPWYIRYNDVIQHHWRLEQILRSINWFIKVISKKRNSSLYSCQLYLVKTDKWDIQVNETIVYYWWNCTIIYSIVIKCTICVRGDYNCVYPRCLVGFLLIILLIFCVVIFYLFVFFLFVVYPVFPVFLDCLFLITASVFSNVYCVTCNWYPIILRARVAQWIR